jgi:transcriptional regulator with XRE-family HTH domain
MTDEKKRLADRIGNNIRAIRQRKGMSIEKLAFKSDIGYMQLSRIELGKINTTIYQVYKISKSLEVDLHELFHLKDN